MLRPLPLILVATMALGGCARLADSRLNPLNWFSGGASSAVAADGTVRPLVPPGRDITPLDARVLIADVTGVSLERTEAGAILRATGVAATQGFFNAELVAVAQDGGLVTFEFRVEAPPPGAAVGSVAARTITVAEALSAAEYAGITQIRVIGASGAQTVGR